MSKHLTSELKKIISTSIHIAKSKCHDELSTKAWEAIDSGVIAEKSITEIVSIIEQWLYIPCCHVTGMHDPEHFEKRKYICDTQKANAFERFCKDLGVNPTVKSEPNCGWCTEYLHYRKGEGLTLFKTGK